MKKFIFTAAVFIVLIVLLVAIYDPAPGKIQGCFYIRSEKPLVIFYTNQLGKDEFIRSDDLEVPFEINRGMQQFYYRLRVCSDNGPQDFMVKIYFDYPKGCINNIEQVFYSREEWIYEAVYYPPWSEERGAGDDNI